VEQPGIHGEEASDFSDEPTLELPVIVPPPNRTARRLAVAAGAAVLLLLAVLIVRSGQTPSNRTAASRPTAPGGAWSTPAGRPASATFEVADGAATISFRTAELGAELYRVDAPGARPQITEQDGRIRLNVADPTGRVRIALAADVRWDLRIGSGVELSTIDLSGARPHAVDLTGGAGHIDLTLPRPDGTLTVRMTGGVNLFDVHTAQHVPVRVRVGSGAGRVVLDGLSHHGVAAGALFTPDRWAATVDRIDVDAVAGMSALTVATY
jgi:hypothetical protein